MPKQRRHRVARIGQEDRTTILIRYCGGRRFEGAWAIAFSVA